MDVEFVDELPPGNSKWDGERRRQVQEFAAALRDVPYRWARYPWQPSTNGAARKLASNINRHKIGAFANEAFRAVCRQGVVYVRYAP